jgi:hypothetical protein
LVARVVGARSDSGQGDTDHLRTLRDSLDRSRSRPLVLLNGTNNVKKCAKMSNYPSLSFRFSLTSVSFDLLLLLAFVFSLSFDVSLDVLFAEKSVPWKKF